MRHNHHMRQLAILYFEGRATDEEELRLLEFILKSATIIQYTIKGRFMSR